MSSDPDQQRVPTDAAAPLSGLDVGVALATAATRPLVGSVVLGRRVVAVAVDLADPVVDVLVLHPPLLPARLHPGGVLGRLSRRGARERAALQLRLDALVDALVPRVTDELVRRLDLDAIVARIDVAALARSVIAEVDLPGLIRESTAAVSSETAAEVRLRGAAGDDAVARAVDRLLLRHRRAASASSPAATPLPQP